MGLLDKICQALIRIIRRREKWVLVWENASPTSNFPKQFLPIDLTDLTSGQNRVAVEAKINTAANSGTNTFVGTFTEKSGVRLSFNYGSNGKILGYYRSIEFTSNNQLTVNSGYASSTAQDTEDNGKCIPLRIFKIFGGAN